MTKIVAISDVHGKWNSLKIPECDILISTGDYSFTGEKHMVKDFHKWLDAQDAHHIISVQGNHEKWVEKNFEEAKALAESQCPGVHFIDEGLVEVNGIKIWCSAITPWFYNWAWNRFRGENIKQHWDKIPNGVDIVATHGPAYGLLDGVERYNGQLCEYEIEHVGCKDLLDKLIEVKPKIHLSGHIHGGHGHQPHMGIDFYNASICDEQYRPTNPITVIEYNKGV